MAVTANFGWIKATVSGDNGAWGTILNTMFDQIDNEVKVAETSAATALAAANVAKAETLAFANAPVQAIEGQETTGSVIRTGASLSCTANDVVYIQMRGLAPGLRLTQLRSRGIAPAGGAALTVTLAYIDNLNVETIVGSTTSHGTGESTQVGAVIAHDVAADRSYYFKIALTRGAGTAPSCRFVQAIVTRP